ncbi:CapA family protein [Imperialibacter roseus]|uniref:CapA family protein n=1 Tax=Imperialibacter roseus TaxID=1324217 RepID=A0ABZ0IQB4_9BACT|nr:CapA family protein [Imperialibacter roseus]WOK06702.1 CapA family protein [Imperialibacter roseus]
MEFFPKSIIFCILLVSFSLIARGKQDTTYTRLLFVGDIMQHGSQIRGAYHAPSDRYSYEACLKEASKLFQRCDLVMGNLELTLAGKPYQGYPKFSAPSQLIKDLQNAGLDIVATANNHTGDHGYTGIARTSKKLDSLNMPYTGTFATQKDSRLFQPFMVNQNRIRIAIFNYTFATNLPLAKESSLVVSLLDSAKMKRQFAAARALRPDITIAYLHWGTEYEKEPDSSQIAWGKFLHAQGVDIIIGSHPHTLQPIVWDKDEGKLTVYSIGNFLSGQRERFQDGGLCLELVVCRLKSVDSTFVSKVIAHPAWVYKSSTAPAFYSVLFPYSSHALSTARGKGYSTQLDRFMTDTRKLVALSSGIELSLDTVLAGRQKRKTSYYQIGFALPRSPDEINDLVVKHPELTKTNGRTSLLGPFQTRTQATRAAQSLLEEAPDLYIEYVINTITHPSMQAQDSLSPPLKQ